MSENKKPLNNALKYSGIGFQIIGTCLLGFYIGYKCDEWLGNNKPYLTTLFAIIFLIVGFYLAFKDLMKK